MRALPLLALALTLATSCSDDVATTDAGAGTDAASVTDASPARPDAAELEDAGASGDAASTDAEPRDASSVDAAPGRDAAALDAAALDAATLDAAALDATPADAASPDAAAADSGITLGCDVVVTPPDSNAGQVGANGGSPGPALVCPAGAEVVGVAVRMSDGQTGNNGRSAVGFDLACAELAFDASGAVVLGAESLVEVAGSGQFGWTPATLSPVTRCPPGSLVSGLSASRGSSANRFLDLTITCTELRTDGTASSITQVLAVAGSLAETGIRDTVDCPPGEVVRIMETRIGAGFDAASLVCAAPACAP
ncbi:hypothetical protein L6R52_17520 [Myxococcota bacterium]|nr:hypothetical protein [Myxococcota bacterium]